MNGRNLASSRSESDTPTLELQGLTLRLPPGADREFAVSDVSLKARSGQVVCLLGESAAGKSLIALTVMGLLPRSIKPTAGKVLLQGEELRAATRERLRKLRGARMGMIFQEPMTALNPVMTAGAQVEEVLIEHTKLSRSERRARILECLRHVHLGDPERIYDSYPHQLSGGQRQRIMIAMALILKPALLIADEPTSALDVTTQSEILRLIRELQRENDTAVLFITHDFGVVAEIADEVAVLRQGQLVESGPAERILANPRHPYTQMLLDAVPSLTPRKEQAHANGELALRTVGLTKVFSSGGFFRRGPSVTAAEGIDLEVRKGETLGVVGESGSGKTTLARLMARLLEPTAGDIQLGGVAASGLRGHREKEFRRRVQIVFQDPYRSLNPRRTVGAAIAEGPMNFGASRAEATRRAEQLMELVRLPPTALPRYPHEFSGGQRQRICIARALACGPELLIADEPLSALDVSVQARILKLLEDIQRRLELTLVFITHDLRVAAQICDRVIVMQRGRVVEQGSVTQVFLAPKHSYTRALIAAAPGRSFFFSH